MSEQNPKPPIRALDDDIDLGKAVSGIGSFFRKMFKAFFNFLEEYYSVFLQKIKSISILVVLGIIGGALYFFLRKPYYGTSLTLYSEYFYGELLDNTIKNLDDLCNEKNYKVLSQRLKIDSLIASKIKSIKIQNIIPNKYKNLIEFYKDDAKGKKKLDSLLLYNNESLFKISMEVYDTSIVSGFDSVLIRYIVDNEYIQRRMEIDRKTNLELEAKINKELQKLDSLKTNVYKNIETYAERKKSNGSNNVILAEESQPDPLAIFREDISYFSNNLSISRKLFLQKELEVIEEFIPFARPKSGKLLFNIARGGIIGISLGFIMVLGITARRKNT